MTSRILLFPLALLVILFMFELLIVANADGCAVPSVTWNQSGTFLCVDINPKIETTNGIVKVVLLNGNTVNVTVSLLTPCNVRLEFIDPSNNNVIGVFEKNYNNLVSPMTETSTVSLSYPVSSVIYRGSICNVEIPVGAVRVIPSLFQNLYGNDPIVTLFVSMIPGSIVLGFALQGDIRRAGIGVFLSLPGVIILGEYLGASNSQVMLLVSIGLVSSIVLYLAGGRSTAS